MKDKQTITDIIILFLTVVIINFGYNLFYFSNSIYIKILGFLLGPCFMGFCIGWLYSTKTMQQKRQKDT